MQDAITIETALFNHRDVLLNFINPCCFGEDFAVWLSRELAPLVDDGFILSNPIQEDYGWGLWASHEKDTFWIALTCAADEPKGESAEWVVSVNYDAGPNVLKRLLHKPDPQAFTVLRDRLWHTLKSNPAIKIVEP